MTEGAEQPTDLAAKSSAADIYSHYAMGDMLDMIAKDHEVEEVDVKAIIRDEPKDYHETNKSREALHRLRAQRQLSLCDKLNLAALELAMKMPRVMFEEKDFAAHVAKLTRIMAHRHALNEGKVTSIVGVTEMVSDEEMRRRIQVQDEAGDGLAVDDIGEVGSEGE